MNEERKIKKIESNTRIKKKQNQVEEVADESDHVWKTIISSELTNQQILIKKKKKQPKKGQNNPEKI